ncbi:DNA-protecting protein DprA [Alcaligenes faecalis]
MRTEDVVVAGCALALLRDIRLSPGSTSKIILAMPAEATASFRDACSWINENLPRPDQKLEIHKMAIHDATIRKNIDQNIYVLPISSDSYPDYLRKIVDPPPVIYLKGNLNILKSPPGVAIVGTRKPSRAGEIIANRISQFFAQSDWTVVSGLALGIDAAAHRGAIKAGGPTIAVLAHGLKSASPKINSILGQEILDQGGAWISEHSIETSARKDFFVHRNRIQIGLSAGSIIVEGEEKSGTMTQAEYCLQNKRTLFAVLPDNSEKLEMIDAGPKLLVQKRGAIILRSKQDYEDAMRHMSDFRGQFIRQY